MGRSLLLSLGGRIAAAGRSTFDLVKGPSRRFLSTEPGFIRTGDARIARTPESRTLRQLMAERKQLPSIIDQWAAAPSERVDASARAGGGHQTLTGAAFVMPSSCPDAAS